MLVSSRKDPLRYGHRSMSKRVGNPQLRQERGRNVSQAGVGRPERHDPPGKLVKEPRADHDADIARQSGEGRPADWIRDSRSCASAEHTATHQAGQINNSPSFMTISLSGI